MFVIAKLCFLIFCYDLCHRFEHVNICYSEKNREMRGKFPRILYWKDVKIAYNIVRSAFNTNLVSVLSVILRCNDVHIIFLCVLIFTMSRSFLNWQCQMKSLNTTL